MRPLTLVAICLVALLTMTHVTRLEPFLRTTALQQKHHRRRSYSDDFKDPGGNSALRAASKSNPRNQPCPTCLEPNRLTPRDVRLGYQCDECADAVERGW